MNFRSANRTPAPPVIKFLTVILAVLTAVILYSLVMVQFGHDTFLYVARVVFCCLGALVVLIVMGIASVLHRRREKLNAQGER